MCLGRVGRIGVGLFGLVSWWFRRGSGGKSGGSGEVVEGCRLNAAPDAPYSCPEHCSFFEQVRVSRAGWTVGSLGAPQPSAARPPAEATDELFATLAADFDRDTISRIEAEEDRRRGGGKWWKKKKK